MLIILLILIYMKILRGSRELMQSMLDTSIIIIYKFTFRKLDIEGCTMIYRGKILIGMLINPNHLLQAVQKRLEVGTLLCFSAPLFLHMFLLGELHWIHISALLEYIHSHISGNEICNT
ncbi:hypothetical protein ACJX0J_035588 [Zea mays]